MTGNYTEILGIVAPSEAVVNSIVNLVVTVRSLHTATMSVKVGGTVDSSILGFSSIQALGPGESKAFNVSFIMPNSNVTVVAVSYYRGQYVWVPDDEMGKSISLTGLVTGAISKKELEYDESRGSIPVSNVPQGERGLVHIWGRNDTDEAQRMGISWIVKDPNGIIVEEYSTWEAWPYTGAGSAHEFIGDRFNLDKVGIYTISVGLLMNPDNPTYVDIYYGDLCSVVTALIPQFSGFAIKSFSMV